MSQPDFIELLAPAPGVSFRVAVLRYGRPGRGPKAYVQAALHADEVPALLVAQRLAARLGALEAQGQIAGEVVLVPSANPIGLAQRVAGQHHGRFDLRDGVNFNRGFAELGAAAAECLQGRLNRGDADGDVALVRAALRDAAQALPAATPAQDLKRRLLQLAIDADTVLDLHCDGEAEMHLYALSSQREPALELAALLGARALLLADESGDSPFDEACSRPWAVVRAALAPALPLACFAATVELRGETDTDHRLAEQDAQAIVEFLRRRGVVAGAAAPLPAPQCEPTPLSGSEPIEAPHAGVVVYRAALGAQLQAGQPVLDLVDVGSGAVTTLAAASSGRLYARAPTRWAAPGQRLGKIAGTTLARSGRLLKSLKADTAMLMRTEHKPLLLEADAIVKRFGPNEVLKGVSVAARQGDVISMIGASGSGKSTFLRCLNLLEQPNAGRIALGGEELRLVPDGRSGALKAADPAQLQRLRARVSMVFQHFNLWAHMTALENVIEAPVQVLGLTRAEAVERAERYLARVGVGHRQDAYPAHLSGGEQQRVAIARALAMEPQVMLFDEPTSALDPELVGEVLRVMRSVAEDGRTMIVVTHEMSFAREVSNHLVFLHQGRIEEQGDPREVLLRPRSERLQAFLSNALK